jgi:hypothetical protein
VHAPGKDKKRSADSEAESEQSGNEGQEEKVVPEKKKQSKKEGPS